MQQNTATKVVTSNPIWPASKPLDCRTRVKWYDPVRRFGFLEPHDHGGDIWFNWLTLLRNKIDEKAVEPDMEVQFSFMLPDRADKQRSVISLKLL